MTEVQAKAQKVQMGISIGEMTPADWDAVCRIYAEGIATGLATLETSPPTWESWDAGHLPVCRYVARRTTDDEIIGWAALSPVSSRCVYAGVAEESVYIAQAARGQGVGRALLNHLTRESEVAGFWTLQAGIFPENRASIALHQACGFRIIGTRERIGQLHGVWRDVVLMERRSAIVGI